MASLISTGLRVLKEEGWSEFTRQIKVWLLARELAGKRKLYRQKIDLNLNEQVADTLAFTVQENPRVSIIIPCYNGWKYTLACLKSVMEKTDGKYEVILVDDASTDCSYRVLSRIKNISIVKNESNLGFLRSCNKAAEVSRGRYLLFLNNDTVVTEGWLPALMKAAQQQGVGAVGARLLFPSGKIQEAGGIVWQNGQASHYGRFDDADRPEYNYVREVDYCSAACLLVKKELFIKIGLFDKRFIPGYYEDTDLCFSMREAGYKVVYQPEAVVVHFEGVTGGTDLKAGIKRYQGINRGKFEDKWGEVLKAGHYRESAANLFQARSRKKGKRILIIDQWVPRYDRDAASFRMSGILKILSAAGHNITFIGDDLLRRQPYTGALQQMGIEVVYAPYVKNVERYLKRHTSYYDIIWLCKPQVAIKHIDAIKRANPVARIIYDTVDLAFLRLQRQAEVADDISLLKKAGELKTIEYKLIRQADTTLVVSEEEKKLLETELAGVDIRVLSNIHDIHPPITKYAQRQDLLFVGGMDHFPNIDAVFYFIHEILPLVKKRLPEVRFIIAGNIPAPHPAEQVYRMASPDVIVTGYVEDLAAYYEKCRVFVAPLRYGAGVKGKINQSMSHGLPVVTTYTGAEGMYLQDGMNALIAGDAQDFADKTCLLYTDEDIWNKLSYNSLDNVTKYFSYAEAERRLNRSIISE